jgi:hypothetical protein
MADGAAAAVGLESGDPRDAARWALASAAGAQDVGLVVEAACWRMLAGRALARAGEPDRAAAELTRAAANSRAAARSTAATMPSANCGGLATAAYTGARAPAGPTGPWSSR